MDQAGFPQPFGIETVLSPQLHTIKVVGELDSGSCDALLREFERVIAERDERSLSLDLQGVSFIDSSGMRSMIQIERLAEDRGAPLVVVPPPDDVTQLLRTAGIAERMNLAVEPDRALGPDFIDRVSMELEREPHAPGRARAEVREALAGRLDEAERSTVVLLTSELVTNAVVHPSTARDSAIGLRITIFEDGVRVEVEDGGEGFDPAAPTVSSPHGGRGLFLVDACAQTWGAEQVEGDRGARFRVWFEFASGDRMAATASG